MYGCLVWCSDGDAMPGSSFMIDMSRIARFVRLELRLGDADLVLARLG